MGYFNMYTDLIGFLAAAQIRIKFSFSVSMDTSSMCSIWRSQHKGAAQTLNIMIDSIIFYVHDCYTGCNSSQPQKNKFLPIICTGARCPEKSKNRQDISRKRGNAQKIWTPYTQMECNTRGSEGWRTPCPGKHGITSQITQLGSQRGATTGKVASLSEGNMWFLLRSYSHHSRKIFNILSNSI